MASCRVEAFCLLDAEAGRYVVGVRARLDSRTDRGGRGRHAHLQYSIRRASPGITSGRYDADGRVVPGVPITERDAPAEAVYCTGR